MEFDPPIYTRSTEELIEIANYPEKWDKEAIQPAQAELKNRNISKKVQREIVQEWDDVNDKEWSEELERRKNKGYDYFSLVILCINLPKALLTDWCLKGDGYHRMHRQHLWCILVGVSLWVVLLSWAALSYDDSQAKRYSKISNEDVYEWEREYYSDEEFYDLRTKEIAQLLRDIKSDLRDGISPLLLVDSDTIALADMESINMIDPMSIRVIQFSTSKNSKVIKIVTTNPSG